MNYSTILFSIIFALVILTSCSNTDIPKDCLTWFDGCNTCAVTYEGLTCTKMACNTMQEPRCIGYDITHKLDNIDIPKEYTVTQSGYDTGFAGATDAYSYNTTFDVSEGVINIQNNYTLFTIEDIKDKVFSLEFNPNVLVLDQNNYCFIHEQWGVSAAFVCFEGKKMYYFEMLNTKGNHQSQGLNWKTEDIQEHEECNDSRSIFCNVFYDALVYDEKACEYITQSYCDSVHEMIFG